MGGPFLFQSRYLVSDNVVVIYHISVVKMIQEGDLVLEGHILGFAIRILENVGISVKLTL